MTGEKRFFLGIGVVTVALIVGGVFFLSKNQKPLNTPDAPIDQNIILSGASHTKGDQNAPLKIVEFGDFQCPACGQAYPIVKQVLENNKDKIYFVFRHYPLTFHKNSKIAAQAAESASIQGKFWEMHDLIYENQKEWSEASNAEEIFTGYAEKIGIDKSKFKEDIDKSTGIINEDYALGNKVGVESTPTFFVNGKKYPGVINEQTFQALINASK